MPATLEIPPLICFTLKKRPEDKSLGLQLRQGEDDAVEVVRISPDGPAALTPLRPGYEILSVNDHRVRDAQRCVEMFKHYSRRGSELEVVASAGERCIGCRYVMVKGERRKGRSRSAARSAARSAGRSVDEGTPDPPGDGSLHGLLLEENGGRVRVTGFGASGMFVGSRINRGDVLLSVDGRPIHGVDDCRRALRKVTRTLVPVLTYNLFRKFRSGIVVRSTSSRKESAEASPSGGEGRGGDGGGGEKPVEKLKSRCVGDLYAFGPTIGSGGFSVVKKCKLKETGETYAMKIVNRRKMDRGLEHALKDEISMLNGLDHPHIIRLYDTFATINSYYLVTEYLDGGELFNRIVDKSSYTEKEARDVCTTIFGAMAHCHGRGIAHRDLKPENLLLRSRLDDLDLKIADFGFAKESPTEASLRTLCGSPGYVSPEILRRVPYGTKTDVWSIGVIVFILLSGYPPFQDDKQSRQFECIKRGEYRFVERYWGTITDEAKSLIRQLLCVDPRRRLSAAGALEHPWMQSDEHRLMRSSLYESKENLREYNASRKFKSAVQSVMFLNRMSLTSQVGVDGNASQFENGNDDDDDDDGRRPSLTAVFTMRQKVKSLLSTAEHAELEID